jgi:hypothetical protein
MPAPVSVRARDVSARRGGSERDRTTSRRLVSVSAAPSLLAYCWLAVRLVGLSLSSHMQIKCLPLLAIGVSSDMLCKSRHRAQTTAQSCSGAQPTPLATYIHPSRPRASAHDACFAPIWSCSSALAFQPVGRPVVTCSRCMRVRADCVRRGYAFSVLACVRPYSCCSS